MHSPLLRPTKIARRQNRLAIPKLFLTTFWGGRSEIIREKLMYLYTHFFQMLRDIHYAGLAALLHVVKVSVGAELWSSILFWVFLVESALCFFYPRILLVGGEDDVHVTFKPCEAEIRQILLSNRSK